jgi:hypothetical protein
MKFLLLVLTLTTLSSCGLRDTLSDSCGNGVGCEFIFGYKDKDQDKEDERLQIEINELNKKLAALEVRMSNSEAAGILVETQLLNIQMQIDVHTVNITALEALLDTTVGRVDSIEVSIVALQAEIDALEATSAAQDANLQTQIDSLALRVEALEAADYQTQINNMLTSIASLTLTIEDSITRVFDPCGDAPGQFDEIILQTNSGKFIAYFESAGNRFLTVITNGNYRTTDAQKCNFNVNGTAITPAVEL